MNRLDIEKSLDSFYEKYNKGNYIEAIQLLKTIMDHEKKISFWYYSRLSSCYYELREYEKALEYAKVAYKMQPNSAIVLWDYASALLVVKKEKRAIKLLSKLQQMEDDFTVYKFEKPQKKWMQSLKNDANYLIGKAYYILNEDQLATEYFLKYLSNRKKGLRTIYKKKKVLNYLDIIAKT